jgi:hypothetical protein
MPEASVGVVTGGEVAGGEVAAGEVAGGEVIDDEVPTDPVFLEDPVSRVLGAALSEAVLQPLPATATMKAIVAKGTHRW